ncbi:MAG: efflux RND transporter periplasmic adaptor subunit [Chthoniobacterales bacterium]
MTALGRVTPGRAAISIAAQTGSRILKLEVTDGQKVHAGDVLAYLETYPLRLAERDAAQIALDEARERLETETQYASAVVEQSEQAVRLLEIAVERERKELTRVASMKSAIEEKKVDDQKFAVDSREGELAKARAELRAAHAGLARTRTLVAVHSAEAKLKAAEAQLELTIIRAPINGEILKVFTYAGERIGNDPILKMGDTSDMHVIAEVHETDIGAVRIGQRATITSAALPEPVQGVVEEIGALIFKNDVLDIDPRADRDSRIVEVRIKLDKSEPISRFTHLEVSTRIDLTTQVPGTRAASR